MATSLLGGKCIRKHKEIALAALMVLSHGKDSAEFVLSVRYILFSMCLHFVSLTFSFVSIYSIMLNKTFVFTAKGMEGAVVLMCVENRVALNHCVNVFLSPTTSSWVGNYVF